VSLGWVTTKHFLMVVVIKGGVFAGSRVILEDFRELRERRERLFNRRVNLLETLDSIRPDTGRVELCFLLSFNASLRNKYVIFRCNLSRAFLLLVSYASSSPT
jgi:hypothetical protein